MAEETPVLALRGARLALEPGGGLTAPLSLALDAGGLLLADLRGPQRGRAFADAALGLLPPSEGVVLFQGRNWQDVTAEQAGAMRGRVGRLSSRDSWLPELGVDDNILLAARFHTLLPERVLRDEAARLATRFGLPGLPLAPPEALPPEDLHRAALVRAFLNTPALVVLEDPLGLGGADLLQPLMGEIDALRDRGGALLWISHGTAPAIERYVPATQRLRLAHGRLETAMDDAA